MSNNPVNCKCGARSVQTVFREIENEQGKEIPSGHWINGANNSLLEFRKSN